MSHDAPVTVADLAGLTLVTAVELFRQLDDDALSRIAQASDLAWRLKEAEATLRSIREYLG